MELGSRETVVSGVRFERSSVSRVHFEELGFLWLLNNSDSFGHLVSTSTLFSILRFFN